MRPNQPTYSTDCSKDCLEGDGIMKNKSIPYQRYALDLL